LPGCGENRRCEMAKPETELDVKSKDIDKAVREAATEVS
jgi:hypothetical protein